MSKNTSRERLPFSGKLAVVTGASKGIGKATAAEIVRLGGSVCIIARDAEVLTAAREELERTRLSDEQIVASISADCAKMEELKQPLTAFIEQRGAPHLLVNNVGFSCAGYAQELSFEQYQRTMEVNYYGQLAPTLVCLPHMLEAGGGHLSFVSSMMGYFGIVGYVAYAPAKFAVVGLAEALRHELKPYNITVSVIYPPDVDTETLHRENETKPEECVIMSRGGGLLSAERCARIYVSGILKNQFDILPGNAKPIWRAYRYAPQIVRQVLDHMHRSARKQLGKPSDY
jgi:3-dehydrosphinganine reductase